MPTTLEFWWPRQRMSATVVGETERERREERNRGRERGRGKKHASDMGVCLLQFNPVL